MSELALVTGAHGFLGRHIARRLAAAGWRVVGLGHGDWASAEPRDVGIAEWRPGDVTPESLAVANGVGLIVHCAGGGAVGASLADPVADFGRTVATTAAVLDFARRQKSAPRIVYPSSPAVHGITGRSPIVETVPQAPLSPYGLHKSIAEQLCRFHAHHDAIPVAIVRLFSVYGVGLRKQLLWDACNKMTRREFGFSGTGAEQRDWLHVDDATALLLRAAEHAAPGCPVVNGGSGVGTANRDVLSALARLLGADGTPNFTGWSRPGDPPRYVADIARAKAWGWAPERRLDEGLAEYVHWFQALP